MRALSFLWGEEFCIKKCKCFLLIAHDAVYIYHCVLFFGHIQSYTEFHIIQFYFLSRTHEQTQANTSTVRATDFHLFCMFDSHLKIWTNEIEKTKPQYIPIPILDHH